MTLFEEIQKINEDSHSKWFERYFKKYEIVKRIKEAAEKGFKGYLIDVASVEDEYTRRRLSDDRTITKLQELLGDDFVIDYRPYYKTNILNQKYETDKKIEIKWG